MVSTLQKIAILGENSKYDICASTASNSSTLNPTKFKIKTARPLSTSDIEGKSIPPHFSSAPLNNSNNWVGNTIAGGVCHSYTPDGRCVSLFKVLYTNKCIYNCKYCFSQTCKTKVSFTPEEYARTFMKLYTMNVLEGLFLSSGVCGNADETTEQMIKTLKIIRHEYGFRGYVHFKCLPGTSYYLLKEAIELADRISVNVEAPTKEFLSDIAEQKNFNTDIIQRQKWLKQIRFKHNEEVQKVRQDQFEDHPLKFLKPAVRKGEWIDQFGTQRKKTGYKKNNWDDAPILNSGQTTQMVLGAAGESDFDILKRLDWEYREIDLRRGYFSAFTPIEGTPLEQQKATPLAREHRLYQTDWLLRIYNYKFKEIKSILDNDENLPQGDPKIHLARERFGEKGVIDINFSPLEEILRVPGIGPISAQRIVNYRKTNLIKSRLQLKYMGVVLKRADPFIKINGTRQQTLVSYL
jgi:putative DNA modification/repair radical SAM protein